MTGSTSMVYTQQCGITLLLALILKNLGFRAIPIISYMSQAKKLGSLNALKSGECNILLCSDFVSKGLDIPAVDMVINYNIPLSPNDYIYRVGWTVAHVNVAISFVSPDERRHFNIIEKHIGKKLPLYPAPFEEVLLLEGRAIEAERLAQEGCRNSTLSFAQRSHTKCSVLSNNSIEATPIQSGNERIRLDERRILRRGGGTIQERS
ncbi:putative RNA helicase [Medicago truncatula]|uniref:DEAD-box ATP-dependent RNA helicase, putative n=1 Tax=Medicago truncatula TaxID=3880 RepID=A0A072VDU5_MEDTR|nr:DEAD-box ATP-dependent RNA helicase, putative [Medicago truncatula]RHN77521.1 putative RNA helicase [Medicago truncatula]